MSKIKLIEVNCIPIDDGSVWKERVRSEIENVLCGGIYQSVMYFSYKFRIYIDFFELVRGLNKILPDDDYIYSESLSGNLSTRIIKEINDNKMNGVTNGSNLVYGFDLNSMGIGSHVKSKIHDIFNWMEPFMD